MTDEVDLEELLEDEDHLEQVARLERVPFPAHLLTTDPLVARRAMTRVAPDPKPPPPPPEVPARPAPLDEAPPALQKLRAKATDWTADLTYGRGPWGKGISDLFWLKLHHPDGRRAVAVYRDGKFHAGFLYPSDTVGPNWKKVGAKALTSHLTA